MTSNDTGNVASTGLCACHVCCCTPPPPSHIHVRAEGCPKRPVLGNFFVTKYRDLFCDQCGGSGPDPPPKLYPPLSLPLAQYIPTSAFLFCSRTMSWSSMRITMQPLIQTLTTTRSWGCRRMQERRRCVLLVTLLCACHVVVCLSRCCVMANFGGLLKLCNYWFCLGARPMPNCCRSKGLTVKRLALCIQMSTRSLMLQKSSRCSVRLIRYLVAWLRGPGEGPARQHGQSRKRDRAWERLNAQGRPDAQSGLK